MRRRPALGVALGAVLVVEGEVLGPVQRTADADLDHAPRVDRALLDRPPERRAVEELAAEVLVPRVGVRVKVHDGQRPVLAGQRADDRQGHRVIASHAQRPRPGRDDGVDLRLDGRVRALDGDRHHVHVAAVGHPQLLEGVDLEHGVPRSNQRGLLADGARPEACARTVGHATVVGQAQQGDVEPGWGIGRRQEHERGELTEPRRDEGVARTGRHVELEPRTQRR